jgi:hypothetical protein
MQIGLYCGPKKEFVDFVIRHDPTGECQNAKVSESSPGPSSNSELLARFVFSPTHTLVDDGELNDALFSDVFTYGASVTRIEIPYGHDLIPLHQEGESQAERIRQGSDDRPPQPNRQYLGLIPLSTGDVRATQVDDIQSRLRVYDTAVAGNPLHADIIANATGSVVPTTEKQLRKHLRVYLLQLAHATGLFLSPSLHPSQDTSKLGIAANPQTHL